MTGYIQEMRRLVGHRTIIQCAASVICVDELGRALLGKRTDNHLWGYSGGGMDLGESVEECARRELYEEMGLEADELTLFMVNSGPESHMIYPNGDETYYLEIIYVCRSYRGEPRRQPEELEEIRFFRPEELRPEMISPPIRPVFREYMKARGIQNDAWK
jgi:8-oxo-dGTP pyrophosphatase MutT (NUDIX family)